MRKEVYRMPHDEAVAFLSESLYVNLATTLPDGMPVLKTVHGVVLDGAIAFHGAPAGEKTETIGRQAVVSAEERVSTIPSYFIDPRRACPATTYYRSVQVHGTIEAVTDPVEKTRVLDALLARFQPEGGFEPLNPEHPLYRGAIAGIMVCRIPFERISGKAKLAQNRRPDEIKKVMEGLWKRGEAGDPATIELLRTANPTHDLPDFLASPPGTRLVVAMGAAELSETVGLLKDSYWNLSLTSEQIAQAHLGSAAWVGVKDEAGQVIGSARAISDGAKCAWIYDVIIAPKWRGKGVGQAMLRLLLDHPRMRTVAQVRLGTRDAERLYARFGFVPSEAVPARPYTVIEMALLRS